MFAIAIFLASSWTFIGVVKQCQCTVTPREAYSVENVILARRVVNEVNAKEVNQTNDAKTNETIREIKKYLKNQQIKEQLEEDQAAYKQIEKDGELLVTPQS